MRQSQSAASSARRFLLIPVLPVMTIVGLVVVMVTASVLPPIANWIIFLAAWPVSLYHAARRARAKWVVAIAVLWPLLIGYWIYVGFRLDRE